MLQAKSYSPMKRPAPLPTDISSVRLAGPGDEDELLDMLKLMHLESGPRMANNEPLAFCESKVRTTIRKATAPKRPGLDLEQSWVGVIANDKQIEASVCLSIVEPWYTNMAFLNETWNFVRPEFRKKPSKFSNAKILLVFCKRVADELGLPLLIGVLSPERQDAKMRLYERAIGCRPIGGYFLYNAPRDTGAP